MNILFPPSLQYNKPLNYLMKNNNKFNNKMNKNNNIPNNLNLILFQLLKNIKIF